MSSLVVPEQGAHVTGCVDRGAVIVGRGLVPSVPGEHIGAVDLRLHLVKPFHDSTEHSLSNARSQSAGTHQ